MARTPFKQRSSPVKGKLQDFFNNVGSQLEAGQKDRGIFSEKGKAEKADRKPGESKFKADVRRRKREANKSSKAGQKAIKTINKDFKKDVNSPTNTKPGELKVNKELMSKKVNKPESNAKVTGAIGSKTRKEQYDAMGFEYDDTIKGYNRDGSSKTTNKKDLYKSIASKLIEVNSMTGNKAKELRATIDAQIKEYKKLK